MIALPYGKENLTYVPRPTDEVLYSRVREMPVGNGAALVEEAMAKPYGPSLRELAVGKANIVIIISDHTRPVPSKDILPGMLREIREGNPSARVTLLVATGVHRGTTVEELRGKLGDEIYENYPIVIHNARKEEEQVYLGVLPSGAELWIDRVAAEADLLVAEGFIEPHFFAGYSGGRKSVLPGVSSAVTVLGNHCSRFIASDRARTGILDENPIHEDMRAAAKMAGLRYIVNVIINGEKETVAAFAGDPEEAHGAGCRYLAGYCGVKPQKKGDIVITTNGGYPLDQNIYQSVKGLTAGEGACRDGGVLIITAACADGTGGEHFYRALRDAASPAELYDACMQVPQAETKPDQWQYQILARIMKRFSVIFVSSPEAASLIRDMKLGYAGTLSEAIAMAEEIVGKDHHRVIIPDGISVVVEE
ncbi:MAG: nickel-dependent lactate racemase [Clostridia bacterium]|nr:nickel-dependent lactate racemase [Clostridia bacterium]